MGKERVQTLLSHAWKPSIELRKSWGLLTSPPVIPLIGSLPRTPMYVTIAHIRKGILGFKVTIPFPGCRSAEKALMRIPTTSSGGTLSSGGGSPTLDSPARGKNNNWTKKLPTVSCSAFQPKNLTLLLLLQKESWPFWRLQDLFLTFIK